LEDNVENNQLYPIRSELSQSEKSQIQVLDLQSTDFLCNVETIKKLFALSCSKEEFIFATHRISNTLFIDFLTNLEAMGYPNHQSNTTDKILTNQFNDDKSPHFEVDPIESRLHTNLLKLHGNFYFLL
jgi:hypothetical protein